MAPLPQEMALKLKWGRAACMPRPSIAAESRPKRFPMRLVGRRAFRCWCLAPRTTRREPGRSASPLPCAAGARAAAVYYGLLRGYGARVGFAHALRSLIGVVAEIGRRSRAFLVAQRRRLWPSRRGFDPDRAAAPPPPPGAQGPTRDTFDDTVLATAGGLRPDAGLAEGVARGAPEGRRQIAAGFLAAAGTVPLAPGRGGTISKNDGRSCLPCLPASTQGCRRGGCPCSTRADGCGEISEDPRGGPSSALLNHLVFLPL